MKSRKPGAGTKRASRPPLISTLNAQDKRHQPIGERGYTLVALLAVMAIMLLLISSVAPSVRQQAQRSREEEAIARGEEVAEAIRRYTRERGALPTSIDQLLDGIPRGTKKLQILRAEAARDPLSSSGEWKLIKKNDAAFLDFQRAVMMYAGGRMPETRDPLFVQRAGPLPQLGALVNIGAEGEPAPGGEDNSENSTGPFIGVTSRSKRASVITYYGIERHDQWVFTPYFK